MNAIERLEETPLRQQLERIVADLPEAVWRTEIEAVGSGTRIELVHAAEDIPPGTCFAYALPHLLQAVEVDPLLNAIALQDPFVPTGKDVAPDSCFIRWLWINERLDPGTGLLLYFDRGMRPVHAARQLPSGRAVSKWGTGDVWCHPIDAVPSRYGAYVAQVAAPGDPVKLYREYLRSVYPVLWSTVADR